MNKFYHQIVHTFLTWLPNIFLQSFILILFTISKPSFIKALSITTLCYFSIARKSQLWHRSNWPSQDFVDEEAVGRASIPSIAADLHSSANSGSASLCQEEEAEGETSERSLYRAASVSKTSFEYTLPQSLQLLSLHFRLAVALFTFEARRHDFYAACARITELIMAPNVCICPTCKCAFICNIFRMPS